MRTIEVTVRKVGGKYLTDSVLGIHAASSTSPSRAAERLAEQLWGKTDLDTATRIDKPDPKQPNVSRWRITDAAARNRGAGANAAPLMPEN